MVVKPVCYLKEWRVGKISASIFMLHLLYEKTEVKNLA